MVVVVIHIFFKGHAHLTLGNLFRKLLQYELTIFFNVCQGKGAVSISKNVMKIKRIC